MVPFAIIAIAIAAAIKKFTPPSQDQSDKMKCCGQVLYNIMHHLGVWGHPPPPPPPPQITVILLGGGGGGGGGGGEGGDS